VLKNNEYWNVWDFLIFQELDTLLNIGGRKAVRARHACSLSSENTEGNKKFIFETINTFFVRPKKRWKLCTEKDVSDTRVFK